MMAKVLGIGGVFFKRRDSKTLDDWYKNGLACRWSWLVDPEGTKIELWQPPADK